MKKILDYQKVMLSAKKKEVVKSIKTEKCPLAVRQSIVTSVKVVPEDCVSVLTDVKETKAMDETILL